MLLWKPTRSANTVSFQNWIHLSCYIINIRNISSLSNPLALKLVAQHLTTFSISISTHNSPKTPTEFSIHLSCYIIYMRNIFMTPHTNQHISHRPSLSTILPFTGWRAYVHWLATARAFLSMYHYYAGHDIEWSIEFSIHPSCYMINIRNIFSPSRYPL